MAQKIKSEKAKAHTSYYNDQGDRLPGVTTVLGVLAKPALIVWANRLGLEGIDSGKYVDKLADVGTIVHGQILAYFKHDTFDVSEYAPADVKIAERCLQSFHQWRKSHTLDPIILETPLSSTIYGYGGTPDYIGRVDGTMEIIDFKTGSGIFEEAFYQVAAYRPLAKERNLDVVRCRILRIPRSDDEDFEERVMTRFDRQFKIFWHCLQIYNIKKEIKRA